VAGSAARSSGDVACILLAAGGSRRLGRPKQLVRYRARPLLLHAVAAARGALPHAPLIVVVGADALRMRLVLRRAHCGARAVVNPRWREGMATSLRAGLAAAPRTARAFLLLLTDQPLVTAAQLERLAAAWRRRPSKLAAARYAGRAGVPAIVPRAQWRALRTLRGDEGARALLRRSEDATLVDMPQAALDVDTPADVLRLGAHARSLFLRRAGHRR
jgi:molybdenum cofactor cytidylyltransferase